ncbi:Flp family type IVb pilin [Sphingomonas faeni]|uniref:Flp family type IVb pilin n=1 Tax=Sphingomonas faeni TaxID=185950 RepID=UPI0027D76F26|nr:Flp family type IVb pilin [Sphingomonas faeni]
MRTIVRVLRDKRGATAIEYGLIAALIAVAAIAAMTNLGTSVGGTFNNVSTKLNTSIK